MSRRRESNAIPSGSPMLGIKMKDGKFSREDLRRKHDLLSDQKGGFGIEIVPLRLTLADRFLVPPFSVLDARQGYWQARKRLWLSLGIQSELGRGENELDMSAAMVGITDQDEKEKWNESRRNAPRRRNKQGG